MFRVLVGIDATYAPSNRETDVLGMSECAYDVYIYTRG